MKADIYLIKESNCFTHVDDPEATAALTETLNSESAINCGVRSVDLQDMSLFRLE
jgi:hypothetical protein